MMMMLNCWRLWRRWWWYWWWWLILWFSHRWWQWWWWFSQFCAIGAKPNQRVRLDNRLIGNFASGLRPSSWGSILWGDKVNFFANKLTQGNTFTNRLSQQSINFQAEDFDCKRSSHLSKVIEMVAVFSSVEKTGEKTFFHLSSST